MNDRTPLDAEALAAWARQRGLELAEGIEAIRPAIESLTGRLNALGLDLASEDAPPPEFLEAPPPEPRP